MPNSVGENQAKRKLAAGELVLSMGVNQMRTPNIAMIAAACGFHELERRSREASAAVWFAIDLAPGTGGGCTPRAAG